MNVEDATLHSNLAILYHRSGRYADAESAARRAVRENRKHGGGWHMLGVALREQGRLSESAEALEHALVLLPDFAVGRVDLGDVYRKQGNPEAAVREYRLAIRLDPSNAAAHNNLAIALGELLRYDEALVALRRAAALREDAKIFFNIAEYSKIGDDLDGAMRAYRRALELDPEHVQARAGLASVRAQSIMDQAQSSAGAATLRETPPERPADGYDHLVSGARAHALRRYDEAWSAFEEAERLLSDPSDALVMKALVRMEEGKRDAALGLLERLGAHHEQRAWACYSRAHLKKFAPGDPEIAEMERLLGQDRRASAHDRIVDRTLLRFALGKACDDTGETQRAFAHFSEGNRLKRATLRFDVAEAERAMAALEASYSPAAFARLAGSGDRSEVPIFVVGMPRSGTSLIEQILASHPLVFGVGELADVPLIAQRVDVETAEADDLDREASGYVRSLRQWAPAAARIVDKLPANFHYAGLIHLLLPAARIVHCRRDPLDTCWSNFTKLFVFGRLDFTYDLRELGRYYRAYERLMSHWRAVLPPQAFLEIEYEAVVVDLEGQTRRLLEFCGLPWDDACLRFHETERGVRTASFDQVRQPLYATSIGRWRRYARELEPLIEALHDAG